MAKTGKIVLIIVLVLFVMMVGFFVWIGKPVKGEKLSFSGFTQNIKEFFVKTELRALKKSAEEVENYKVKITSSAMDSEIIYLKAKDRKKMKSSDISTTENYFYLNDKKIYIYNTSTKTAIEMPFSGEDERVDPGGFWNRVDLKVKNLGFEVINGKKCYVFLSEDDDGYKTTFYISVQSPTVLIRSKNKDVTFDYSYSRIGEVDYQEVTLPDEAEIQEFSSMTGI